MESGFRGPVRRMVDTPRSRFMSRGKRALVVDEKGFVWMECNRSEGRRKVGGCCCILVDLRSCLIAGLRVVDVDIVDGGLQWRCSDLLTFSTTISKYFQTQCRPTGPRTLLRWIAQQHVQPQPRWHLQFSPDFSHTRITTRPQNSPTFAACLELADASTCFGNSGPSEDRHATPSTNQTPPWALRRKRWESLA
jgi:hypothetical protein